MSKAAGACSAGCVLVFSLCPSRMGGGTGLPFLSSITLPSSRLPGTHSGNLPLPFLPRYIIYVHVGDSSRIFFPRGWVLSRALVSEVSCSPQAARPPFHPLGLFLFLFSKKSKRRQVSTKEAQNAKAVVLKVQPASHPHQQPLEGHGKNRSHQLPTSPTPISVCGSKTKETAFFFPSQVIGVHSNLKTTDPDWP